MTNVIDRLLIAEEDLEGILGTGTGDKTFSEMLSDLDSEIDSLYLDLSTIEYKVDSMESDSPDSLTSRLSTVEDYCDNLEKFATDSGQDSFNKFLGYLKSTINTLNTTMITVTNDIDNLEVRISALENMIASGTADPEDAGLNDNTKYYIKYEE